jgi:hypothetical protein
VDGWLTPAVDLVAVQELLSLKFYPFGAQPSIISHCSVDSRASQMKASSLLIVQEVIVVTWWLWGGLCSLLVLVWVNGVARCFSTIILCWLWFGTLFGFRGSMDCSKVAAEVVWMDRALAWILKDYRHRLGTVISADHLLSSTSLLIGSVGHLCGCLVPCVGASLPWSSIVCRCLVYRVRVQVRHLGLSHWFGSSWLVYRLSGSSSFCVFWLTCGVFQIIIPRFVSVGVGRHLILGSCDAVCIHFRSRILLQVSIALLACCVKSALLTLVLAFVSDLEARSCWLGFVYGRAFGGLVLVDSRGASVARACV